MDKPISLIEPKIKKIRGSYFPPIPHSSSGLHSVENLDGTVLYFGSSEYVARLVLACMAPRNY